MNTKEIICKVTTIVLVCTLCIIAPQQVHAKVAANPEAFNRDLTLKNPKTGKVSGWQYEVYNSKGKRVYKGTDGARLMKRFGENEFIKVRARSYKLKKGRRAYSKWTPYTYSGRMVSEVVANENLELRHETFHWDKVKGATGYYVYVKVDDGKYKEYRVKNAKIRLEIPPDHWVSFKVYPYKKVGSKIYRGMKPKMVSKINS